MYFYHLNLCHLLYRMPADATPVEHLLLACAHYKDAVIGELLATDQGAGLVETQISLLLESSVIRSLFFFFFFFFFFLIIIYTVKV